jgi:K(+)-stimulated pyrophosphate-energized sodium pump
MEEGFYLTNLAAQVAETGAGGLPWLWYLAPIGAVTALIFAYVFYRGVMEVDEGEPIMREIAQAVRIGAMAYLVRQYKVVLGVFVALFVTFLLLAFVFRVQHPIVAFAFLTSGFFSGLCGFIGMKTATNASARTANAARSSLNGALRVAFRAGAVMGLVVVGFALLDISFWFFVLYNIFPPAFFGAGNVLPQITVVMVSFSIGASTQALFARVGGGIYTKAADVGADLVGKVEAGIPEDDPRNPATIADNVGDNVGDVAGMGADLYESYAGSILATAALGVAAATSVYGATNPEIVGWQLRYLTAPMVLAGVGILLSILGVYMVRAEEGATMQKLLHSLERGVMVSSVGIAALALPILYLLQLENFFRVWIAIVTGLLVGIIIGKATEYYTSHAYAPTRNIAAQAATGPATVIIEGLAVGMRSTGVMVTTITAGILISFFVTAVTPTGVNTLMGLFGIGIAAVGMLSTLGVTLATDAYGPIADNAGGNAEMSGLDPSVRRRTDQLDALGNTTAATGKGFAIGSAALTVMALMAAYLETIRFALMEIHGLTSLTVEGVPVAIAEMTLHQFMVFYDVTVTNPLFLVGLFLGAMTAFFFCALTMSAVGRSAGAMVEEVRRQFREFPGILEGTQKPDYAQCVAISTAAAQREMILPSVLAIVVPVAVGILFGVAGVLGLLAGALAAGFSVAVMMANSGGAWDNAKKYIEEGAHGGKGSPEHKAAVVGDTVGDPFKDTSGPSLNILIKLMSIVSVVFAGLVVWLGPGGLIGRLIVGS